MSPTGSEDPTERRGRPGRPVTSRPEGITQARCVVVTGGNRGIGAAVVARLSEGGHRVASISRSGGAASGVLDVRADITDPDDVEAAIKAVRAEHGPVDALVCNAGTTDHALLPAGNLTQARVVMETNLWAPWLMSRTVVTDMLARRWGRVVFVSSVLGGTGAPGQSMYAATKASHLGLARSIAWELGSRGVTANVVAPGMVETAMLRQADESRRSALLTRTPAGRVGEPHEVAAVVDFLISDASGYVNGAHIPVSGGLGAGA